MADREYREIRKRLGDNPVESSPYVLLARKLLSALKQDMAYAALEVGVRHYRLANKIYIKVMSIFGQDTIEIKTPSEQEEEEKEVTCLITERLLASGVAWDPDYGGLAIPIKWTPGDGLTQLQTLPAFPFGQGNCICHGSGVIFGYCFDPSPTTLDLTYRACYWNNDGVHDLGFYGVVQSVSDDGRIVMFWNYETDSVTSRYTCVRDLATGVETRIPAGSGMSQLIGYGMSADGSVVVGYAVNSGAVIGVAWRWSADTGTEVIGHASSAPYFSEANNVSGDGETICGKTYGTDGETTPWYWRDGKFTILPAPANAPIASKWLIQPIDISRYGKVIVGSAYAYATNTYYAFRYYDSVLALLPKGNDGNQRLGAQSCSRDGAYAGGSYVQYTGDQYETPIVFKGNSGIKGTVVNEFLSPELRAMHRKRIKICSDGKSELIPDYEDLALSDTYYG